MTLVSLLYIILSLHNNDGDYVGIAEPLYIHPESSLYNSDPTSTSFPEFVVYGNLVRNQAGDTTYMSCLTEVSPEWIPELARDCPLLQVRLKNSY